jgi:hypothetical protein
MKKKTLWSITTISSWYIQKCMVLLTLKWTFYTGSSRRQMHIFKKKRIGLLILIWTFYTRSFEKIQYFFKETIEHFCCSPGSIPVELLSPTIVSATTCGFLYFCTMRLRFLIWVKILTQLRLRSWVKYWRGSYPKCTKQSKALKSQIKVAMYTGKI